MHKTRGRFTLPAPFLRLAPLAVLLMFALPLKARANSAPAISRPLRIADTASSPIAQDTADDDDDKEVPPGQLEKYISAYKQMQKDHNLTADQAASKQGLTIAQFRSLEGRIERDDVLRERVRKALRNAAPGSKESAD